MAKFRWTVPPSKGWSADRYIQALDRALGQLLDYYWAPRIEADARRSAPWTDRTGNARQTLAGYAVQVPRQGGVQAVFVDDGERLVSTTFEPSVQGGWVLILRHGMSYGKHLELGKQGRFSIVLPTLQSYQRLVWNSVKELVS